jgi:hypothetical protein
LAGSRHRAPVSTEQINSFDEPSRLFFMEASMFGVPLQALPLYLGPSATMRVKVASLCQVARSNVRRRETAYTRHLKDALAGGCRGQRSAPPRSGHA